MANKINRYGECIIDVDEAVNLLMSGYTGEIIIDDKKEITDFEKCKTSLITLRKPSENITVEDYHDKKSSEWLIPDEYKSFDIFGHIRSLAKTTEEKERVEEELHLYQKYNLVNVLRSMKYLVDYFKGNNILWGVGRGSSVSSYCLYLLDVHMIDSIKYDLRIEDFLREK